MKFLNSLIFLILTTAVCAGTWFLFSYFTPTILKMAWYWFLIIFVMYGVLIDSLSRLFKKLKSHVKIENILVFVIAAIFCYFCMKMSWYYMQTDKAVAVGHNLLAIAIYGTIAITFRGSDRRY